MAEPANLTLAEAAAFVASVRQIEPDEARRILVEALQNSAIVARGAHPMNAHRDADWAWKHSGPPGVGIIPSGTWFLPVDWALGRVWRYRHITIAETELTALFRAARGPGARAALEDVKKTVEAYVALERENQRPRYESHCINHVKKLLPKATRAQIIEVYRSVVETPKPRGRPRKENPPE